jgi:DHA2 family multidrug resistance protein-like MFS transporter
VLYLSGSLPAARAGRREWTGLAVIALPCAVYAMDLTVLNLALPAISRELKPSNTQLLWIVDIYGFMVAGLLMTMGTLGDRIGRRRLLMAGALAFGIASVVAAFSTSAEMLIAMRAVLGIAGATVAPSTLSLIRNMFGDPRERTVAIGVWISSYSAGAAIGPVLGGALLEYFWWGSAFLVSVPVMVLLLLVGPALLPEYRDPKPGRLDLASAALSLLSILSVIDGVKRFAAGGAAWLAALTLAAGLALGWVFVQRQGRLAEPMIDLRLFRRGAFSAALATYTLATLLAFGVFIFVSQYFQLVLGMGPLEAGLWTMPFAFAFIAGSLLTPALVGRYPPARLIPAGFLVAAAGFALLAAAGSIGGPWLLTLALFTYSLGLAPVFTLATDLVVGNAPPERAGAASAISETGSELGGALGIALLGSIGAAVYGSALTQALPAGLTADVLAAAHGTLGGALDTARQLGGTDGPAVAAAARSAFVASMQAAALAASAASLLVAGCVRRALAVAPAVQAGSPE